MKNTTTHFVVQTAAARQPGSWKWTHPRRRVAVLEIDTDIGSVSMISSRARGCHRVVKTWELCYVGSTDRCQYGRALAEARELADQLNVEELRLAA